MILPSLTHYFHIFSLTVLNFRRSDGLVNCLVAHYKNIHPQNQKSNPDKDPRGPDNGGIPLDPCDGSMDALSTLGSNPRELGPTGLLGGGTGLVEPQSDPPAMLPPSPSFDDPGPRSWDLHLPISFEFKSTSKGKTKRS